ncbi:MAG: HAD family phosphatase [Rikenellaceae bacterium]|nr:HAD family phosphatase [Rikenellaceae bacterium]
MKKAVIFDMDGVLVDNRDIHIEAFEILCTKHGLPFDREKILRSFGQLNEQIFEALLGKGVLTPAQVQEYGIEKEEIYREIFAKKIEPANGLIDLLKDLKSRGIKISVGSSGPLRNVQYVLDRCGIAQYFDAISNGDMVSKGKPDPEIFLLAAKLLGMEPEDCLVFEDAFVGIEAARRAGMNVVALATTFPKEVLKDYDMVISDFSEIDGSIVEKF